MDDVYLILRIINLTVSTSGFWVVLYKGIRVVIDQRQHYNWAVFFLGTWFFASAYGTGEQLYLRTPPGPRAFMSFMIVIASFVYVVRLKAPYAKQR